MLPAILAGALLLRVVYVLQSQASPLVASPRMDALHHLEWARALLVGREHQAGPFFRAPLYPWFLTLLLQLGGGSLLFVRLAQAALGALSCLLVQRVALRAFGPRTALLAAALTATTWILIYFEGELLLPVLEVPLGLWALLAALRWDERQSVPRALLTGLALGAAALVRPNFLILAPLMLLWMAWRAAPPVRARLAAAVIFAAGLLAPILPISAYNRLVGGDWVLISSQGGLNLWIGNNPASDGSTAIVPGTRADWWGGHHDAIAQAEAAEGRVLRPSEVSRHYTRRALAFWRDQPLAALRLTLWKLRLFWTDFELGNNQDERFFALRFGPVLRWLPVGFGLLAPLALVGLALSARRAGALGPLWGFVPLYALSVVAFFVCARLRVPVLPVLAIFAAHTLVTLWDALRARAGGRAATIALPAALLALGVAQVPARVDTTPAKGLWQLGLLAAQAGDDAGAVRLYQQSLEANPRFALAHQDLGLSLERLGRPAEAERALLRALELWPGLASAQLSLAELLLRQGRWEESAAVARAALDSSPWLSGAAYALGRALWGRAESQADAGGSAARALLGEARSAFERAQALARTADESFRASYALGQAQAALGLQLEVLGAFESALRALPEPDTEGWYWRCQAARLVCLRALGRSLEAERLRTELLERHRDDPRARAALGNG